MLLTQTRSSSAFRERLLHLSSALETLHASRRAYAYIFGATLASYVVGLANPYLMPVLNGLAIYPLYLVGIRQKRLQTTLRQVFFWAICMSAIIIAFTLLWPDLMRNGVLDGEQYKTRMLQAIRGPAAGPEGTWQGFVAKYVREAAIFLGLAAVTVGAAALIMGAFLMNYMNYYVGYLFSTAKNPAVVLLIGWPPWSIVRVVGFNMTALAVAYLVLHRIASGRFPWRDARRYLVLGMGFIVLNVLLRLVIEPHWKHWIAPQI